MKRIQTKKTGTTVIELIIVFAVLGILAGIIVPNLIGIIEHAQIAADQSVVRILNNVTPIFRNDHLESDPFSDSKKSDEELLEELTASGFLSSVVKPQTKNAVYSWISEDEKWHLLLKDSFYIITLADGFSINKNGRVSGSYTGKARDIVIPASLEKLSIKEINQDVFNNKGMIAVDFESDSQISRIHARAFYNNNLTQIDLPDTVERIDLWSFRNNEITEIDLPSKLKTVEQYAFAGNDLNKITIGSDVSTIQKEAFGKYTEQFIQAYKTGGAGTYLLNDGKWIQEHP